VSIVAGSEITLQLGENKTIYHQGPLSIYLGEAPGEASDWDGSGERWFKVCAFLLLRSLAILLSFQILMQIAEYGATFNPFKFISLDKGSFKATIPKQVPSGEVSVVQTVGIPLGVSDRPLQSIFSELNISACTTQDILNSSYLAHKSKSLMVEKGIPGKFQFRDTLLKRVCPFQYSLSTRLKR